MNTKNLWVVSLALVMGGVLGCSDSDGSTNPYTQISDTETAAIAALCACHASIPEYASETECIDELSEGYSAAEVTCIEGVYDEYETELTASADCRLAALETGEDCINDVAACDIDDLTACYVAVQEAIELCADPPMEAGEAIAACIPNLYDVEYAAENDAVTDLCLCYSSLEDPMTMDPFVSSGVCTDSFLPNPGAGERACLQDVYDENRSDISDYVACRVDVLGTAQDCLDAVVGCDTMGVESCFDAAVLASNACALSQALQDEIESCEPMIMP